MKKTIKIIFSLIIITIIVTGITGSNLFFSDNSTLDYDNILNEYSYSFNDSIIEYSKKIITNKLEKQYEIIKIDINVKDETYNISKIDIYLKKMDNLTQEKLDTIILEIANSLLVSKDIISIYVE